MQGRKVWIITGGSRGIGKCIAGMAKKENNVVLTCSRTEGDFVVDVSNFDECRKMIDKIIGKYGQIDVLINNAGIYGPIGLIEENDLVEWKKTIEINLLGAVNLIQLVLPIMKKRKAGKIINLAGAGVGGNKPLGRFSAYYTSKMAIVGLTEVVATEVNEDNIQINSISPGGVNTFFTDYLIACGRDKAGEMAYDQALKQKKSGGDSPELAAKMVLFLASSGADHISGKLLSAKWDKIDDLKKINYVKNNLFNIRRVDNYLYYEK